MYHLSAHRFRLLMRRHGHTIASLAKSAGVTQARVRELRERGVGTDWRGRRDRDLLPSRAYAATCDWLEALTGERVFDGARHGRPSDAA